MKFSIGSFTRKLKFPVLKTNYPDETPGTFKFLDKTPENFKNEMSGIENEYRKFSSF